MVAKEFCMIYMFAKGIKISLHFDLVMTQNNNKKKTNSKYIW